jgi:UDP-sugar pyrophosphorylase
MLPNASLFTEEENAFAARLQSPELGQGHMFESWPGPGQDDDAKRALIQQCQKLNSQYPGGLLGYVNNAKTLLAASCAGDNPYEGCTPTVPDGERLEYGTDAFAGAEATGMKAAKNAAFVLVAGGLGERLGYHGIKVALPMETTTGDCYLSKYCAFIQALQVRCGPDVRLPLFIMTSGDTHEKTMALIQSNNYFGMDEGQIIVAQQEKVPAIVNNDGKFAMSSTNPYVVETKPHGHGDVHMLLHSTGTASKWNAEGRKWIVFFQDTNGLVSRSIPAALGVSSKNNFALNSLTVPRKPGEPVGGICKLVNNSESTTLTINVEYNQLDPLLRATISPDGDVADASGFSPYPGNINVLIFNCPSYDAILQQSGGNIPEFVNPKYADEAKTQFKKPTRLECMMQDFPKLFGPSDKIGFTQIERWLSFSAVKNNPKDARAKYDKTTFAESASTGEASEYYFGRRVLARCGVSVEENGTLVDYGGIPTQTGARVVLCPNFGVTMAEIASKFPTPADVTITSKSSLVLDGSSVTIKSLRLDGALIISAVDGAEVLVDGAVVENAGWTFDPVAFDDASREEKYRIRGYAPSARDGESVFNITAAGKYIIDGNGLRNLE